MRYHVYTRQSSLVVENPQIGHFNTTSSTVFSGVPKHLLGFLPTIALPSSSLQLHFGHFASAIELLKLESIDDLKLFHDSDKVWHS